MKKYHYTTQENATRIMKEGMIPYTFHENQLQAIKENIPSFNGKGIFLWDKKLSKKEELGSVLWQFITKGKNNICQLEIEIDKENLLVSDMGEQVQMYHYQTFDSLQAPSLSLHDRTPASIGVRWINPKKIKIIKRYNILDLVK